MSNNINNNNNNNINDDNDDDDNDDNGLLPRIWGLICGNHSIVYHLIIRKNPTEEQKNKIQDIF